MNSILMMFLCAFRIEKRMYEFQKNMSETNIFALWPVRQQQQKLIVINSIVFVETITCHANLNYNS